MPEHLSYIDLSEVSDTLLSEWLGVARPGDWACYHRSASLERYAQSRGAQLWHMAASGLFTLAQHRAGEGDFLYLAKRIEKAVERVR